jgi:murein DD-endopeptidase MepM/ murein hydrolase activator NlpD
MIMQVLNKTLLIGLTALLLAVAGCGSNDNQQEKPVGLVAPQFDVITAAQYTQLDELILGASGVLSQAYGNRDQANVTACTDPSLDKLHQGVDYAAPVGTPVLSPIPGVVKRIDRGNPADSTILSTLAIFNEQTQTSFIFLHLDTIDANLAVGSAVTIGQHLGTVGARGRVTGPHVHVEARIGVKVAGALCIDGTVNPFEAVMLAR